MSVRGMPPRRHPARRSRAPPDSLRFSALYALLRDFRIFLRADDGTRAFMPPQGILVIAAVLPKHWQVRFIDENMEPATDSDFEWADAVFVSGMHIQRRQIDDICRRAHRLNKVVVLGGPSVSACPDYYPELRLSACRRTGRCDRRADRHPRRTTSRGREQQVVLKTKVRRELSDFPRPPMNWRRSIAICSARSNFRAAAPTDASSATFPAFMAACRG